MRYLPLAVAGAMLGIGTLCPAQTTKPAAATQPAAGIALATTRPTTRPATLPSADSFISRLGNDDWRARTNAEEELVRMGEDARPIIRDLLSRKFTDNEIRARLEAASAQIDEDRATGPSYITLHFKDAPAKEVFAELSRQCYAELKPFPENLFEQADAGKITIDIDRAPFWTAMKQVSDKTGIDLQQYSDGLRLMRGGFRQNSPFSVVKGPFLIVATTISRSQTEMLANGGASSSDFSMQLIAYSEPKLKVVSSSSAVSLKEATDDAGNSLLPTDPSNRGYYGGSGGAWNLFAQLKYPDHPGKRITRIQGSAAFTIQTRSQRVEIPDIKNVKELNRIVGDMPVLFHELKRNGENWELRLTANPQKLGPNRWNQFHQSVQTALQLLDANDQPLDHRGMSSQGNANGMQATIMFGRSNRPGDGRASGEPVKVRWEVSTATKELRLPFEFKDLPMPK